jgi:hypothetical protein
MHCKSIVNMNILPQDVNQVAHTRSTTRRHASCEGEDSSGLPTSDGHFNPSIAARGIKYDLIARLALGEPSVIIRLAMAVEDEGENPGLVEPTSRHRARQRLNLHKALDRTARK